MNVLFNILKPTVKEILKGLLAKELATGKYAEFKARVLKLSPEQIVASFEGWLYSFIEKI